MQQSTRLFHIKHQLRCAGIFTPKSGSAFTFGGVPRQRADPRRTRFASLRPAGAHLHAGIKHNLRHTRCSVYVTPYRMTVVSWRMPCFANIAFSCHQKLCSTAVRFPLRWYRCSRAGNMADKVKLRSAPGRFNDFQSPAGFAVTSLPCCRSCSHADKPAAQNAAVFADGKVRLGVTQNGDMRKTCFLQSRFDGSTSLSLPYSATGASAFRLCC